MSVSNPCTWYTNGYDEKSFTYEGGSKLFHFSPYNNGLDGTYHINMIFAADNNKHAVDVIKRMISFAINCQKQYTNNCAFYSLEFFTEMLKRIKSGKFKGKLATEVKMNQFFTVGWASNDTI